MSSKANIDTATGRIWESHWRDIELARANKKLLLVEGDDDKVVVESLLRWRDPLFESKVYVGVAGDRTRALTRLKDATETYRLVDRDTWDDNNVRAEIADRSKLVVTTGWCIENHFCSPTVIAAAVNVPEDSLRSVIDPVLKDWYRYGAIWWVKQRFRGQINDSWPKPDCGHPTKDPCPDEASLRLRFSAYAAVAPGVQVDHVIHAVNQRLNDAKACASERVRIEQFIHGKQFFTEVVVDTLNKLLGQRKAVEWRVLLADNLGQHWPTYLIQLADELLKT